MAPPIVQNGDPVLRKRALPIPLEEIKSSRVRALIKRMRSALLTQDDGVALAAPQVGVSLRLFIVSKKVFALPARPEKRTDADTAELKRRAEYFVFINPVITKLSREKAVVDEGCLSVRPLYGKIKRSKKATVTAYDENGVKFTRGASGLLAQIFQHECDHLDGVLFIDKATSLKALPAAGKSA